jgi:uncharacterized oxidoreductase
MKATGNTILVTGGGSGIGAGLAQRWHDAGNTVIVAGRRREALDGVIAGRDRMHARALDVDDAAAIDAFAAALVADFPDLDVLVNNAGVMRLEPIDTRRDLRDATETVTTNLLGPIRLINALVDHLAARPDAAIVNVTSGLAFVPLVDAAVYSATKAAIHAYTVALRYALAGRIEVIELAPPGVQTDLTPGQADRPGYMPLDAYLDAVTAQFAQAPTPAEIVVERARWLRTAEAEGRFEETVKQMNDFARQARSAAPASAT